MLKKSQERVPPKGIKPDSFDFPYLTAMIQKSWRDLLQDDLHPSDRDQSEGLESVFREIFPIVSPYDTGTVLEYINYYFEEPKYDAVECIRRSTSYTMPLYALLRLTVNDQSVEESVYLGQIPKMTPKGTFIINGAERVIVSQLHRSPGITFDGERNSKGVMIYFSRIIPYRGSWLEIVFDSNGQLWIFLDRKRRRRKVPATMFLRALGYTSNADIIEQFFETKRVSLKSQNDIRSLRQCILAEDVLDPNAEDELIDGSTTNSGILAEAGQVLNGSMLNEFLEKGINKLKIAVDADINDPIIKQILDSDPTRSQESALNRIHKILKPGEPTTAHSARNLITRLFFDSSRYNLGKVGRYKINTKLNVTDESDKAWTEKLRKEDIIGAIKYLISLNNNKPGYKVDDIDHLGNRRVRAVGELLQNQIRMGLARGEKACRDKMARHDNQEPATPSFFFALKVLTSVIHDFFGRSQLSQFMDQTNPLAELTHKRRLSSLGPGGLNRERAGFEVRDVHYSHYGRICPIETPEGPNIGLITSLSCFAMINEYGFIETPYRKVIDGQVTDSIEYLTADQEEEMTIASSSADVDEDGNFTEKFTWARHQGDYVKAEAEEITHIDVSPKQMISLVTSLIPFLEHDDANRALMGSNMQRQAVPLLKAESPIVGTGIEKRAALDSNAVIAAEEDGVVEYCDAHKIVVKHKNDPTKKSTYLLKSFMRSNAGTCINQKCLCQVGSEVKRGDILADGPSTDHGELALGKNVLVAFMPWYGYNYEDAIIISEELVKKDTFTSVHIEDFDVVARETKIGKEEITRNLPHTSDEAVRNLDENGIIRIGSEVGPGDILVGKVSPKGQVELSPEGQLLNQIFGDKTENVKSTSLTVPSGTYGVVIDVKVFSRLARSTKTDEERTLDTKQTNEIKVKKREELEKARSKYYGQIIALLGDATEKGIQFKQLSGAIINSMTGSLLIEDGADINEDHVHMLLDSVTVNEKDLKYLALGSEDVVSFYNLHFTGSAEVETLRDILTEYGKEADTISTKYNTEIEQIRKGDPDLKSGVNTSVKVTIAVKRKLEVGDKMAGRHGNKGVISNIVPEHDMPYMDDGTPVQIILNPLGVPSRMNIGQLLETHLGIAAHKAGIKVKTPVFDGYTYDEIKQCLKDVDLPETGKLYLRDGYTGERYDNPVVVGHIYMLKLGHLVADKMHARATGPYSLVTQQPLGGKAQKGGQRLGEMEVWALEAYGAAYTLQEMLTVKSDDVFGRSKIYDSIISQTHTLRSGVPESFNVLKSELAGLALNLHPVSLDDEQSIGR